MTVTNRPCASRLELAALPEAPTLAPAVPAPLALCPAVPVPGERLLLSLQAQAAHTKRATTAHVFGLETRASLAARDMGQGLPTLAQKHSSLRGSTTRMVVRYGPLTLSSEPPRSATV